MQAGFTLAPEQLRRFCEKWRIEELALFGSALRSDFGDESDIDLLVSFHEDAHWSLLDHVQMQQELAELLQRDVDLISKHAVERSRNWIRRQSILDSAQIIYRAEAA